MSTAVETQRTYAPEDLLALSKDRSYELVDGRLEEVNVSALSSVVAGNLITFLNVHIGPQRLGWVFPADTLFRCFPWKPNLVRKPDIAFVRRDRLAPEQLAEGFVTVAPDLAVEVISPNDLASELERKLREYRRAGVRMIWVIEPESRTARVHRSDATARDLDEDGDLDGEDVLPGFRCRLGELFPTPPPAED